MSDMRRDFINAKGESLKLSKMKHFNPYCAMILSSKSGFAACHVCDQSNSHTASIKHKEIVYKCHAGLIEVVLPLYDNGGNHIGCMTSGQFFLEGEPTVNKNDIEKTAKLYNQNSKQLNKVYRESKVISKLQMEGIIDYLKTVGQFCRFFKKELGISFTSFVNMYRISQAEEMLKNTKRNISEIAFLTGFGSISQFNRTFKSIKGISAKTFRSNIT